jgi:hypothetical protein
MGKPGLDKTGHLKQVNQNRAARTGKKNNTVGKKRPQNRTTLMNRTLGRGDKWKEKSQLLGT